MYILKKIINFLNKEIFEICICIVAVAIMLFSFVGIFFDLFSDNDIFDTYLCLISILISYICFKYTLDSLKISECSILPYLKISANLIDKDVINIYIENVGSGILCNLRMNQQSSEFINDIGNLESKILSFESINLFVNEKEQLNFIMKKNYDIEKKFYITVFFDDMVGNSYKQVISIQCYDDEVKFMPNKPVHKKRKEI